MDTASTSDAVTFITYVQSLKRKIKQFEKQVEVSYLFPTKGLLSGSTEHLPFLRLDIIPNLSPLKNYSVKA